MTETPYDVIVVGSGPGGQKAAIQAAEAGARTLLIEEDAHVGGACVHYGTIPSKTLREIAARVAKFAWEDESFEVQRQGQIELPILLRRKDNVIRAHHAMIEDQLQRANVSILAGRASFISPHRLQVLHVGGAQRELEAETIVIATGSRPRPVADYPVDHEYIMDSDSILSMSYLPDRLVVLGAGVIAMEYASIFCSLGVEVTVLDRQPRPLSFVDEELVDVLMHAFEHQGGRYLPNCRVTSLEWDGISDVVATLSNGTQYRGNHALVALGRVANVDKLKLENAGVERTKSGHIDVDSDFRTSAPNIYAIGDVIGPPALASTAMEQGRRAACHALSIEFGRQAGPIPTGIYAVPEIASIGQSEKFAREQHGDSVLVGRCDFQDVARGQISGSNQGLLKLIAAEDGKTLLGASIVGDGATELIHIAQVALVAGLEIDALVTNTFNFPTLAEAYRVAALDILRQRQQQLDPSGRELSRV